MADVASGNGGVPDERLLRLSRKPGVKASLVIDRASGSIIRTSGDVSELATTRSRAASTAASLSNEPAAAEASASQGVDDFAAMVWRFVRGAGDMVEEMDASDELRLLRLRTKKHEVVIVLDPKYLLTVIHDTPPS